MKNVLDIAGRAMWFIPGSENYTKSGVSCASVEAEEVRTSRELSWPGQLSLADRAGHG